jgi:hypothetical protein
VQLQELRDVTWEAEWFCPLILWMLNADPATIDWKCWLDNYTVCSYRQMWPRACRFPCLLILVYWIRERGICLLKGFYVRTARQTEETHTSMIRSVSNSQSIIKCLSEIYVVLCRWEGVNSLVGRYA